MKQFWILAGLISIITASPSGTTRNAKKGSLLDTIESLKNGSAIESSTSHPSTRKPDDLTTRPAPVEATKLSQPPATPVVRQSQPTPVVILRPNENIFSGLAESVSQVHLGGIIMEAFKLAQVSIALFAQSLAGTMGPFRGTVLTISNTTKLVGV